jgi:hypothetical protein
VQHQAHWGYFGFCIADFGAPTQIQNPQSKIQNGSRSARLHLNVPGLLVAQRQAVAAKPELDWIAQRRPADYLDVGAIAKSHLQEPAPKLDIAADVDNPPAATGAQAIQIARVDRPGMTAPGEVASLVRHRFTLPQPRYDRLVRKSYIR